MVKSQFSWHFYVIITQITSYHLPTICVISRFLTKSIAFRKTIQMSLTTKKVSYIFDKLDLLVNFFSLLLWNPGKNRAKLKKLFNFNSRLRRGVQYPRHTESIVFFLSATAVTQRIFWTEGNSCFICDCRISFQTQKDYKRSNN